MNYLFIRNNNGIVEFNDHYPDTDLPQTTKFNTAEDFGNLSIFGKGYLYELIFFDKVLSDKEIDIFKNMLMNEYYVHETSSAPRQPNEVAPKARAETVNKTLLKNLN